MAKTVIHVFSRKQRREEGEEKLISNSLVTIMMLLLELHKSNQSS
jgi:hypothetical protein